MSRDGLHLEHIAECIRRIRRYTVGGRDVFLSDEMVQDAVVRNLQTLAESCGLLSESIRSANPDVKWRAIRGFRNVVVHDYLGLEMERIWTVIESELDPLLVVVDQALSNLETPGQGPPDQMTQV